MRGSKTLRGGVGTGGVADNTTGSTASVTMDATQFQELLQAVWSPQPPQPASQPAQVAQAQGLTFALTPGQANANTQ